MSVRAPILLSALLVAVVAAIGLSGDPGGLLLLTPALALLIPLLLGSYPGESSVRGLASWFSRVRQTDTGRAAFLSLDFSDRHSAGSGFSVANGSRGPPAFALNQ
jgi:hypothetical protein